MGCNKSSSKEKVNSDTSLPQKTREISGKQANLPSKGIRKKQKQTKPKVSGKKETIKIREVIIKQRSKNDRKKSMKPGDLFEKNKQN